MKQVVFTFFILLNVFSLHSQEILTVGLYRNLAVKKVSFSPRDSEFDLIANDTVFIDVIKQGEVVVVSETGTQVKVLKGESTIGTFDKVALRNKSTEGVFNIKTLSPASKQRTYYGSLTFFNFNNVFTIVNNVDIEQYLIGVIESESGNYQSKEYYKVQAIISRTYALKHQDKFLHEGFMLTDLVNCQVYFGKFYQNPNIEEAVKETKGIVIVDNEMDYITAAFYSNSGGQTENSENVWNKALPYLKSKADPFSVGKNNYDWKKSIPKAKWLSYLKDKYKYPIEDEEALAKVLNFNQSVRKKYLAGWESHILLTDVRMDFRLKSTLFSISYNGGDEVVFSGHGFGHGVGLSQEGAMNMVDLGYSYTDVINFYYTDVHLIEADRRIYYLQE